MSEIKYKGDVVSSVASEIDKLGNQFGLLSTDMQKATTQLISARGFSEYLDGVSSDSFSSVVDECETAASEFVKSIRSQQISILGYSGDENAIKQFLASLSRKEFDTLDFGPLEDYITVDVKAGKVLDSAGATLLTLGAGVVEGVLDFVETGADLIVMVGTGAASIFTGLYDLFTGSHVTEDMWEGTKAFVSNKTVESIFDSFYADTTVGRFMKDNAYGFDTVRGIGKGVGYTAGVVAVTALTFGAGGAAISAGQLATTAGVMGFSNGTEEAWANGASIGDGLLYGAASGAWEGAQWYAGGKINTLFGNSLSGVAKRVALDTADSAIEGFVQPALSMIYKDYGGSNFGENYAKAFESAGGWGNVGTQAAIGAFASTAGEVSGLRKLLKDRKNSSVDVDASAIGEGGAALLGAGGAEKILKGSDTAVKALPEHIDDSARSIAKNADGSIKALPEHIDDSASSIAKNVDTSASSIAKNADVAAKALPEHVDNSARTIAKNADVSTSSVAKNADASVKKVVTGSTDTSVKNVTRNVDNSSKKAITGGADTSSGIVSNRAKNSTGTVTSSVGKNANYSSGTVTTNVGRNVDYSTSKAITSSVGQNADYSASRSVSSSAGRNANYSTGTITSSVSKNADYSARSITNNSSAVQHRVSVASSGAALDNMNVYKNVDSSGSSSLAAASLYSSKGANVETKMSTSAAKIGESVSKVSSEVGTTFAAGTALGGSGVASLASLSDAKLALGDTSIKTSMSGSDITNISKTMDVSNSAKYDVDYVSKNSTSRVDGINSSSKTSINDSSLVTEKARTSKQLDADLRTLENKYDKLLDERKNAVANYGEKSPQVAKLDKQIDQQFEKIKAKGKEKIVAQNAEYKSDLENLTHEQVQKKYVGVEANKTGAKLIQGDANISNPSAIEGNVTTNKVASGSEVRPNWTDASAKVEGQIDGSALKKLPKDDVSVKSIDGGNKSAVSSVDTGIKSTEVKARTSKQLDADLRTLENKYDKLLDERKNAVANYGKKSPQVAKLDKQIDQQFEKIKAKGKEKIAAQNAEYKSDLENLTHEQVQKKYVGVEANKTGAKLIQGDANISNPSAIEGNVTTNKVASGSEVRPNWTDASAKVEGQIDGSALKKLPKDDLSLKSLDSDSGKVAVESGNKSTLLESETGVQSIKDTKVDANDSSLKFTSEDTIDSVAEKLDNAVERGSITREQADGMFEKAGEELHLAEKEKIVDLRKQNEQYELNKQANIDKKKQIVELDGAKAENIKGYDEAVGQIDDEIAKNNMEIDSLQKKVSEASNSSSNVVKEIESPKTAMSDMKSDVEASSITKSVDTSGEYRLKGDELVDAKNYFDRKEFNQKYGIEDTEYKATGSNVSTDSVLNINNMEKVDLNKTYRNLGQLYKVKDTELNVPGSKLNINNMEKVDLNKTYKNLGQLYKIKDTELNVPGSKLNVDSVANVDSITKSVDTSGEYRLKGDELVDAKNYFDRKEFNQKYGIEDTEYKATGSNVSTDSVLDINNMEKVDLNKTYKNLGQLYKIKDTELNVPGSKLNINNMEKVDLNKTYKNLGQLYKIKDTELNVPGSKLNVDSVANVDSIAKSVDTSGEYRLKGDQIVDAKNSADSVSVKSTDDFMKDFSPAEEALDYGDYDKNIVGGTSNAPSKVDTSGEYRLKGDQIVDAKNSADSVSVKSTDDFMKDFSPAEEALDYGDYDKNIVGGTSNAPSKVDTSGEYRLKGDQIVDAKNSTDSVLNINNMEKVDLNKTYRNLGQLYKIKDTELNVPGSKLNINNMEKVDLNKTYKNLGQLYKIKDTELNVPGSKLNVDSVANVDSIAKSVDTSGEYRLKGDQIVDAKNYFDRKEFNKKFGISDAEPVKPTSVANSNGEYRLKGDQIVDAKNSADSVLNINNMEKVDLNKTYRNLGQLYKIKDTELNVPGSKLNINNMEKVDLNKTYKNLGQLYKIKDTELNVPGSKLNVESVANVDSIAKSVDTSGEYRLKGDELVDAKNYFDRKEFNQKYGIKDTGLNVPGSKLNADSVANVDSIAKSVDTSGEYKLKENGINTEKAVTSIDEDNILVSQNKMGDYNSEISKTPGDPSTLDANSIDSANKPNINSGVEDSKISTIGVDEITSSSSTKLNTDESGVLSLKKMQVELDNLKRKIEDFGYGSVDESSGQTLKELNDAYSKLSAKEQQASAALNEKLKLDSKIDPELEQRVMNGAPEYILGKDRPALSQNIIEDRVKAMGMHSDYQKSIYSGKIESWAEQFDVPYSEMKNIADAKVAGFVNESQFGCRLNTDSLESCLDSGYIKNQFETGSSQAAIGMGDYKSNQRAIMEQKMFGIPQDTPFSDRPVYGMAFPGDEKAFGEYLHHGPGKSYGDCVIIYNKDAIADSTSFVLGDSLTSSQYMSPSTVNNPKFSGAFHDFGANSLEEFKNADFFDTFNGDNGNILELQYHGQKAHAMNNTNIKEVVFESQPSKTLQDKLGDNGIPWRVVGDPEASVGMAKNMDISAPKTITSEVDALDSTKVTGMSESEIAAAQKNIGDYSSGAAKKAVDLDYKTIDADALDSSGVGKTMSDYDIDPFDKSAVEKTMIDYEKPMDIDPFDKSAVEKTMIDYEKPMDIDPFDKSAVEKTMIDYEEPMDIDPFDKSAVEKTMIDYEKTVDVDALDSTKVTGMSESEIAAAQKNIGDYSSGAAKKAVDLDYKTIDADALDSTKVTGMSESEIAAAQKNIGDYSSGAAKKAVDLDYKTIDADALDNSSKSTTIAADSSTSVYKTVDSSSSVAKTIDPSTSVAKNVDPSTTAKTAASGSSGDPNKVFVGTSSPASSIDPSTSVAKNVDPSTTAKTAASGSSGDPNKVFVGTSSPASSIDPSTSVAKNVDPSTTAKTAASGSSGDPNKVFASTSSPASSIDPSTSVAKIVDPSTTAKTAASGSSGDPNKVFAGTSSPSTVKRYGVNQATDVVSAQKLFESKYGNKYKYGVDYDFRFDSSGHVVVDWLDYKSYLAANKKHIDGINTNVSSSQKSAAHAYAGESKTLSYKTMNGVIRDNLLEYDANGKATGVTFHGLYSSGNSLSLKDYADYYGAVDEMLLKNKNAIFDLDNAIRSSTLDEPMVLYRGYQRIESCKRLFGFDPSKMTDKEICDSIMSKKGFVSEGFYSTAATKNASPIIGAKIVFEMNTKPGISALDMSKYGISMEEEILLASDIPFKYTGVRIEGSGYGRKIIVSCDFDEAYNPTVSRDLFRKKIDTNIDKMINSLNTTSSVSVPTRISHTSYPSYINAKSFATTEEMVEHIKKNMSTDSTNISSIVGVINKHLDETNAKSGFSGPMYDDLLGMYDLGLSPERHSKVMDQVINSNHALREQISKGADFEISGMLQNLGITDMSKIKEFKDAILGDDFINGGIGKGADWNKFISLGEDSFKDKVQQGILNGKEPVLWSGFPTETHQLMDSKYTTISNTTIGEMPFVETVYSNWNGTGSPYKAEKLWGQLSTTYAQACCEAEDAIGNSLDSIKFLYPNTSDPTSCFGELFKTRELPEIVSYDEIHKISMAKTNPATMEIEDVVDIDITSLCDYYNQHSGIDEPWKDPAMCNELFKKFNDLVKGAFNK